MGLGGATFDLLVVMRDYSYLLLNSVRFARREYLRDIADVRGFHRQEGVFMAWGHQTASGRQVSEANIMDLAPTILHLMGIAVPQAMDGKVLKSIIAHGSVADRPVVYEQTTDGAGIDYEAVYSVDEADEIRGRLQDLGYLA